ncbi:MAG: site-specific integrase [Nocardioidaceae bacterium]
MAVKNTAARRPKGGGSIFQRADGRWIGRTTYTDPKTGLTRRAQVSGETKKAVNDELKKLRDRIEAGKPIRDGAQPFGEYAVAWIDLTLKVSDRKPSTKALYAGLTRRHIVPSNLGKTPVGRLRARHVEQFVQDMRGRGLSESTVRQVYTVARAIAEAAVRDSAMSANPFSQVRRPKVTRREAEFLTAAEVDKLLEAAKGSRYALLFEFLVCTALRRGEALALRWLDVNMTAQPKERPRVPAESARIKGTLARVDGKLVVGPPKTESSVRTIPLSPDALDVLRRLRARQAADKLALGSKWVDSGFVFTTEFGEPCDPRNALRALVAAGERAGLPRIGLHTLRHSAATMMLNNGAALAVVSRLLGHSSIQVTVDIYGHEDEASARQALAVIGKARAASRSIG